MLKGKTVVLGVSSSIAAYKIRKPGQHAGEAARQCAGHHDTECNKFHHPNDL